MKKIWAVIEHWDDKEDWWKPNLYPFNWKDLINNQFDYGLSLYNHEREAKYSSYKDEPIIKIHIDKHPLIEDKINLANQDVLNVRHFEVPIADRYIYPIRIYGKCWYDFFYKNKLSFVNQTIIDEVKSARCILLFVDNAEGYATQEDFDKIDSICKEYGFIKGNAYYIHNNYKIECKDEHILKYWVSPELVNWVPNVLDYQISFEPDTDKFLFLNFNRRFAVHRIKFLIELHKCRLQHKGFFSYTNIYEIEGKKESSYEFLKIAKTFLAKNMFDNFEINKDDIVYCDHLDKNAPYILDKPLSMDEYNNHAGDIGDLSLYRKTFISIVSETLYTHKSIFFSEKIFKPISLGHPFIINSSPGTLYQLQKLGFMTFSEWIDESYDEEMHFELRLKKIIRELEKLSCKSIDKLIKMREEMLPILKYNQKHLKFLQEKYNYKKYITEKIQGLFL